MDVPVLPLAAISRKQASRTGLALSRRSGYIRVSSNVPLISFAVFGTHTLSALSAIPPQPALSASRQ